MATPDEILSILENLLHAFPGQKISRDTFQVYIDHLSDIHPRLLRMCADNLIAKSTWFPRLSEIRAEAARIVGPHMVSVWEPPQNYLMVRFHELENQFFHHRILDPEAWIALAEEFARCDRPYSAEGARRRLTIFQQLLAEEESSNP
jgi:hypothetical protein